LLLVITSCANKKEPDLKTNQLYYKIAGANAENYVVMNFGKEIIENNSPHISITEDNNKIVETLEKGFSNNGVKTKLEILNKTSDTIKIGATMPDLKFFKIIPDDKSFVNAAPSGIKVINYVQYMGFCP
jgi:hypothetical protein